jgi:ABC-2 type transport system ATP-binding protein
MSLLHRPEVLVLDEPFFGLDPQTLRVMKGLLTEHVQAGMAVMLSTHQLPVIEGFAHRVAVMHQGTLVASGTLEELARLHPGVALEELFFRLTAEDKPDHAGPR